MSELKLLQAAWQALANAYAPYSKFKVGAAIATTSGDIFSGCNVEIANYGCTLCAERTAIVKAVSEGFLKPGQLALVVVATITDTPTAPCGSCRQVIEEFANEDTEVWLSNQPDKVNIRFKHADLLPHSFNAKDLE